VQVKGGLLMIGPAVCPCALLGGRNLKAKIMELLCQFQPVLIGSGDVLPVSGRQAHVAASIHPPHYYMIIRINLNGHYLF
jgi:hypothetical protein